MMKKLLSGTLLATTLSGIPIMLYAQETASATASYVPFENERYLLLGFNILLMLIIAALGISVQVAAGVKINRLREQRGSKPAKTISVIMLLCGLTAHTATAWAQETADAAPVEKSFFSTLPNDIIIMSIVALVQFTIVLVLAKVLIDLVKERKAIVTEEVAVKESKWKKFFMKVNNTVALEDEDKLDLHHDYDGIRELDNRIPKWWLYAFYGTIAFGAIYLYRMFISETMPDQITELNRANEVAKIKMEAYLKNAANNVDENSVVMLDAAGVRAGAAIFQSKGCIACHGNAGEGNSVGPNLTDDYWLHGGSIQQVFASIKYGWPDKGMKSWQADMSPVEIARVASYIKSIHGSNPPNAKAPQGELYRDAAGAGTDSTTTTPAPTDSITQS